MFKLIKYIIIIVGKLSKWVINKIYRNIFPSFVINLCFALFLYFYIFYNFYFENFVDYFIFWYGQICRNTVLARVFVMEISVPIDMWEMFWDPMYSVREELNILASFTLKLWNEQNIPYSAYCLYFIDESFKNNVYISVLILELSVPIDMWEMPWDPLYNTRFEIENSILSYIDQMRQEELRRQELLIQRIEEIRYQQKKEKYLIYIFSAMLLISIFAWGRLELLEWIDYWYWEDSMKWRERTFGDGTGRRKGEWWYYEWSKVRPYG